MQHAMLSGKTSGKLSARRRREDISCAVGENLLLRLSHKTKRHRFEIHLPQQSRVGTAEH
jgi:hypothetical protein